MRIVGSSDYQRLPHDTVIFAVIRIEHGPNGHQAVGAEIGLAVPAPMADRGGAGIHSLEYLASPRCQRSVPVAGHLTFGVEVGGFLAREATCTLHEVLVATRSFGRGAFGGGSPLGRALPGLARVDAELLGSLGTEACCTGPAGRGSF